jgi:hypothetical protein
MYSYSSGIARTSIFGKEISRYNPKILDLYLLSMTKIKSAHSMSAVEIVCLLFTLTPEERTSIRPSSL